MAFDADQIAFLTGIQFKLFIRGCVIDVLNDDTHTYLKDEFAPGQTSLALLLMAAGDTPSKEDLTAAVTAIEAKIDQVCGP
jgi:hypothetical protein